MIDLNDIGVKYLAKDTKGNKITFHLIYFESLLDAVGIEDCSVYDFDEHEKDIRDSVTGIVDSTYDVTWYVATTHQSDLVDAVRQAVREGNRIIVIEYSDVL